MPALARHCEAVGRVHAENRRTLPMPIRFTDDTESAARFVRALGPGTVAGSGPHVIDRIGEHADAGVSEVMSGTIPTGGVEQCPRLGAELRSSSG